MWKKLFKGNQKKQGFDMSDLYKKQIEETEEWMEIGHLIERYRKKSDGGDFYLHHFNHNNIAYELGWRRRSELLELSGEIDGEVVKIACAENTYKSSLMGIVFHLPICEESQMKIKRLVREVRDDLILKIDEQEKSHRAEQEAILEMKQKEIQQKTQALEKYL